MTQPILSAEEILAWNEKTAQGWRQLLTTHLELLTQPCDIAGTKSVSTTAPKREKMRVSSMWGGSDVR